MAERHPAPMGAEHQEIGPRLLPARPQLLVAVIRAAEHEPVAQQLLERLVERILARQYLVLSPFGVGLVLFR